MRLASVLLASLLSSVAGADEGEETDPKTFSAGDLGLDELDQTPAPNPSESASAGIGVNATLTPNLIGNNTILQPSFSLRLWLERLMLEPVLGLGLLAGDAVDPAQFQLSAGLLAGLALSTGNLRPIVGGGMTFAVVTGGGTTAGFTFGPMFGLEYRFQEMPNLALEAALFLPLRVQIDPFLFGIGTSGGALVGFHYYFSN